MATVEKAPMAPCAICGEPTVVLVRMVLLDVPDRPEGQGRVCVACFKAIVDHLVAGHQEPLA